MATVESRTRISIDELINDTVVSGHVTDGKLILVNREGAEIFAGFIGGGDGGGGGGGGSDVGTIIISSPELVAGQWSELLAHDLNTLYPGVVIWDAQTNEHVTLDILFVDEVSLRIRADRNANPGAYRVRVFGAGVADPVTPDVSAPGQVLYFPEASDLWTGVHSFNTPLVSVTTYDAFGKEIEGDVSIIDANTIQVRWGAPEVGSLLVQE